MSNLNPNPIPFSIQVSRGKFPKMFWKKKFGRNLEIDTSGPKSFPADLWSVGGLYTGFPSVGNFVTVTSSDANDTSAGTGARKIMVEGLNTDWNIVEEEITLNGGTTGDSSNKFIRLNRAYITEVGSNETNVGNISVQLTGGGAVFAQISAGLGQTQICAYSIPVGHTGYLVSSLFTSQQNATASEISAAIIFREFDKGWRHIDPIEIRTGQPVVRENIEGALILPAKSDIVYRVNSVSNNNTFASAELSILVEEN